MSEKVCAVYIMTNRKNGVLYTGVTSDLKQRVWQHREHLNKRSFTARYNVTRLVYCQVTTDIRSAIEREKKIKAGSRKKKVELIESMNPDWRDLYEDL